MSLRVRERRGLYYPQTNKLVYPFHESEEQVMPAALGVLEAVGGNDDVEEDEQ